MIAPCLWCSAPAEVDRFSTDDTNGRYAVCCTNNTCSAIGPERPSRDEAVAVWNSVARKGDFV